MVHSGSKQHKKQKSGEHHSEDQLIEQKSKAHGHKTHSKNDHADSKDTKNHSESIYNVHSLTHSIGHGHGEHSGHGHGHDEHGHGHGHSEPRQPHMQGKWKHFDTHVPINIKIPVLVLMVLVWLIAYAAVSQSKGHGHGHGHGHEASHIKGPKGHKQKASKSKAH